MVVVVVVVVAGRKRTQRSVAKKEKSTRLHPIPGLPEFRVRRRDLRCKRKKTDEKSFHRQRPKRRNLRRRRDIEGIVWNAHPAIFGPRIRFLGFRHSGLQSADAAIESAIVHGAGALSAKKHQRATLSPGSQSSTQSLHRCPLVLYTIPGSLVRHTLLFVPVFDRISRQLRYHEARTALRNHGKIRTRRLYSVRHLYIVDARNPLPTPARHPKRCRRGGLAAGSRHSQAVATLSERSLPVGRGRPDLRRPDSDTGQGQPRIGAAGHYVFRSVRPHARDHRGPRDHAHGRARQRRPRGRRGGDWQLPADPGRPLQDSSRSTERRIAGAAADAFSHHDHSHAVHSARIRH
mmetsp:Transcript_18917/g.43665  ORF Transcript_18917/g.43665 Transcript_18917/m.43665 type:complete len:348 (+) Transcript_18917:191-1234(+)